MMEREESRFHRKLRDPLVMLTLAVIVTGVLLRVIYPGSDPHYDIWSGYITDEGRWTEQARNIVLFGSINTDSWLSLIHLVLAPLFQALTTISFLLFDVSFSSARLLSIICGSILLISSFFFLRRRFTPDALFFTTLALAVQPDLLFLSRVAIPEMSAMLFEFLAFAILVSSPRTAKKAAFAGLLTAAALGMKATVAPFAGILLVILVFTHRVNDSSSLAMRAGAYLGALIAPAVITLAAAVFLSNGVFVEHLWGSLQGLKGFIQHASLYSLLSFLFYGDFIPVLNLLLLGSWIMAGLLIAIGRLPDTSAKTIYIGSAIWVAGWLIVSAGLTYFPPRYVIHILVPLILHLGAGITLLQNSGWHEILKSLSGLKGLRRLVLCLWLSFPIAALLCPAVIALADLAGFSIDRFREQLPLLLILTALQSLILLKAWRTAAIGFGMTVLPLVTTLIWFAGVQTKFIPDVFWDATGTESFLTWIMIFTVAGIVTFILVKKRARPELIRRSGYLYFIAFSLIWLSESLPGFINPEYKIADTSTQLSRLADENTTFGTGAAASVFLNNKLHYTEQIHRDRLPDILVVAFNKINHELLENYRMIHQQDLEIGYEKNNETSRELTIKIYQRKP